MGNTCSDGRGHSRHHHHPKVIHVQSPERIVEHKDVQTGNNRSVSLTTPNRIQKADNEQPQKASAVTIIVTANIPKVNIDEKEVAPPAIIAATVNIQKVDTQQEEVAPATTAGAANIQREHTEVEEVAGVIPLAAGNQVDEDKIIRSSSSNSNLVPADACKESKCSKLISLPIIEDEDECPICLECYEDENPKIMIKCRHYYHLGCLYEWMERSATCPMCSKVMEFEEDC